MKIRALLLFPMTLVASEPSVAKMAWPKALRDFPRGEAITLTSSGYQITRHIPNDPGIQAAGGSGGPMVEFNLRDSQKRWQATFITQSIGERLLKSYHGKPQIEIWGRGGGGNRTRCLYRYLSGEYRAVRFDDFEESPRYQNQKAPTTTMPSARRGKGDQQSEVLYFVETRLPN